jgi:DNA repair protein RecO (recombination protein O)
LSENVRSELEPAYILHHRPFRDSSQIIDVFSARHGKLALVARGSRAGRSRLKGLLRPFQKLKLSWTLRRDLGTLTGAEVAGPPPALVGDSLLSAYYVNELLLTFLHRHDPQPEIFVEYGQTLDRLSAASDPAHALRGFEIELLRLLGYALDLEYEAGTGELLNDEARYEYRVEEGPVRVSAADSRAGYSGAELKAIAALDFDSEATLRSANRLLKRVIHFHLGGKELKSRKVLIDLRRDRMRDWKFRKAVDD